MWQIRDWLYTGNLQDSHDRTLLREHNIGALLQLVGLFGVPGVVSRLLYVEDGEPLPPGSLQKGIAFVREQKAAGRRVLVACAAGVSRSTTFAMAALMAEEQLDLFDAYRAIRRQNPEALPHPELLGSLAQHFGLDLDGEVIWRQLPGVKSPYA